MIIYPCTLFDAKSNRNFIVVDISLAGVIVMVVDISQMSCVIVHQLHNYIQFH